MRTIRSTVGAVCDRAFFLQIQRFFAARKRRAVTDRAYSTGNFEFRDRNYLGLAVSPWPRDCEQERAVFERLYLVKCPVIQREQTPSVKIEGPS